MKKYARLRSTSSITELCEPCGREVPTSTVTLDDEVGAPAATPKWNSSSGNVYASSKRDQGEDVSSSASHRVLAEALKKLSSLRETQYEDDPRGVNTTHWGARSNYMVDADAGRKEPVSKSSSFSAGKWPRHASQSAGVAEQGGSHKTRRSISNVGAVAAAAAALGSMGITRTESCTHTSHFTHRRSSSMHDIALSQPAARPSTGTDQSHRRRAGKSGTLTVPPGFPDDEESGWSPPQLRCRSSSAAAAPVGPRLRADLLQTSCQLWEESEDPTTGRSKRAGGVQSMRLPGTAGPAGWERHGEGRGELQSQSMREGAAHASAIAAMAQAYAEKYGVAQAVVECVSCGRGLGLIVEGNSPGSYDSSFCRSCRPPVLPVQAAAAPAPALSSAKKGGGASGLSRGMMHYYRKLLLRMGKKPSHKYTIV